MITKTLFGQTKSILGKIAQVTLIFSFLFSPFAGIVPALAPQTAQAAVDEWTILPAGAATGIRFGTTQTNAAAYGNGRFIVGGNLGKASYSDDGINWTVIPPGDATGIKFGTSAVYSAAYGNDKFVVVGASGKAAYSANGIDWTALAPGDDTGIKFGESNVRSIAYGNGMFVAVGDSGKAAYSANGIDWTALAPGDDTGIKVGSSNMNAIAYGNGKFVAAGSLGRFSYSDDGINWTASWMSSINANSIAYGNDKFVVVGGSGQASYSINGISWTALAPGVASGVKFGSSNVNSIAYGNDKFVVVGASGKASYSDDGINWTVIPPGDDTGIKVGSSNMNAIAYGNGKFVAVGDSGKASYSLVPPTYTLSFDAQGGSSTSDILDLEEDESVTLPASSTRAGFVFKNWNTQDDGDGTAYAAGASYVMPGANTTLYAIWNAVHVITASANAGGSISPSGAVEVEEGEDQTFTITPDSGYSISNVKVGDDDLGAISAYTFDDVQEDHAITASFVQDSVPVPSGPVTGGLPTFSSAPVYCSGTQTSFCNPGTPFQPIGQTQPAPASPSFGRDLQAGSAGADVLDLQRFLNARGYMVAPSGPGSPGNETSTFGQLTRQALAKFQAANGIVPAAGYLGSITRAFIASMQSMPGAAVPAPIPAAPVPAEPSSPAAHARDLDMGMSGDDVRALQNLLISQGQVIPSGATGLFGAQTKAALAAYQAANGIVPAAGYFGAVTRAHMKAAGLSGLWW